MSHEKEELAFESDAVLSQEHLDQIVGGEKKYAVLYEITEYRDGNASKKRISGIVSEKDIPAFKERMKKQGITPTITLLKS